MPSDELIDKLIEVKGAKPRFVGFDWTQTHKLVPRGDAERDHLLKELYAPRDHSCLTRI